MMRLAILGFAPLIMAAGEPRSCADPAAWPALNALRQSSKGTATEDSVEYLYQYRVFLCGQVDAGRITEVEANPLFEAERARLIRKLKQRDPKRGA